MFMLKTEKYSTIVLKMESELDPAEVKKVLEDANMYDPELPQDTMIAYYRVIKDSKNMATVEDETRRINKSPVIIPNDLEGNIGEIANIVSTPSKIIEKSFNPKVWSSIKKNVTNDIPEHNNNQNIKGNNLEELINDSPKDATKVTFGFNEMVKDSEQTLSIITHELKYVPIQNSKVFLTSGTAKRAKMLYAYHTKLDKIKNQLARMSFYPAPLPKVTCITNTFPSFSDEIDFQETYVCRSGRQTKRKVYNYDDDDEDSQDGVSNKKTKNSEEQEWLCKTPQIKNSIRKKSESFSATTNTDMTEAETDPSNDNTKQPQKTESRTLSSKKPTNLEIMKRSSLFGNGPKRRCEAMFDKLAEENRKIESEEKARDLFYKTLPETNEENNEAASNEEVITLCDDEPHDEPHEPVRKRVVPTIPGRKPINNRKRTKTDGFTPLNVTVNNSSPRENVTTKHNSSSTSSQSTEEITKAIVKKRIGVRKPSSDGGAESLPSTSQLSSSNISCPICNHLFSENTIMEHAATCGDEPVTRSISRISRITCEVCDKVVPIETDYDVHVKECIAKLEGKDKNS